MAITELNKRYTVPSTKFIWLELTGKCQLQCEHCYADSGPSGKHGSMQVENWMEVIDDAAATGVEMVQFIGGEPTLHPALPALISHAVSNGLKVEVFSNLFYVSSAVWDAFQLPGISVATSYYSTDEGVHDLITGQRRSHAKTKENIARLVAAGVPLRVGIIDVNDAQDVESARAELLAVGVDDASIGMDYLRGVGRGVSTPVDPIEQFCGNCSGGVLAVMPNGDTHPCVFARQSRALRDPRAILQHSFDSRVHTDGNDSTECSEDCWPKCAPNCSPSCSPSCVPMGNCRPVVGPPY
jgi:MoaA/NifB/PqqE/SkfB family radical SAM enzyme